MESECVQERTETLHNQQNADRQRSPEGEYQVHYDSTRYACARQTNLHDHRPEHFAELSVSQTQSPESEVTGRVRDRAQTVLDSVDRLMNYDVAKVEAASVPMVGLRLLDLDGRVSTCFPVHQDFVCRVKHFAQVVLLLQYVWLDQKHPGHAAQCRQEQDSLKELLSVVPRAQVARLRFVVSIHVFVQEHVDQVDEDGWRAPARLRIVLNPLDEDHQVHIAEDRHQEYDLWYELA